MTEAKHRPTGTIDWTTFVTPGQEARQPVVGVSWADADAFCRWLGAADGGAYDLPTEAQWEYAARAGGAGLWSFGDDSKTLIDHAAVGLATPAPGPVGLKAANPFGLFDVYGGVTEWCRDWHVADYYRRAPIDDPVNLDAPADPATGRAARGGSWNASGVYSRAAFRAFDNPTSPTMPKGFRVALGGDLRAVVAAAAKRPGEAPQTPPAAAVGALRNLVATKEKAREADRLRVKVGSLSPHKLHLADHDVAEARARLAEAEGDAAALAAALRETFLSACRYRDFEYVRVVEGLDRAEFDRAAGLVAEARVKLARAGVTEPPLPPQPAPFPRPKE